MTLLIVIFLCHFLFTHGRTLIQKAIYASERKYKEEKYENHMQTYHTKNSHNSHFGI